MPGLPVSERAADVVKAIKENQVVIVCGETGSGKTTQLPKICLMAGRGETGRIGHTQPRRIAASSIAKRIAEELKTPLGDVVGYRKVYIGGLMLFTVASVGCALSTSLPTLVLARVMQGFGAAAVTSVNTTLIRIIYPKAQLGRGMGINAIESLRGNRLMLRGIGLTDRELAVLGIKHAGE